MPDICFPVYDDLTNRLVEPEVDPATGELDPLTAHILAVAAGYAYSDGQTVTEMMTRLGWTSAPADGDELLRRGR